MAFPARRGSLAACVLYENRRLLERIDVRLEDEAADPDDLIRIDFGDVHVRRGHRRVVDAHAGEQAVDVLLDQHHLLGRCGDRELDEHGRAEAEVVRAVVVGSNLHGAEVGRHPVTRELRQERHQLLFDLAGSGCCQSTNGNGERVVEGAGHVDVHNDSFLFGKAVYIIPYLRKKRNTHPLEAILGWTK